MKVLKGNGAGKKEEANPKRTDLQPANLETSKPATTLTTNLLRILAIAAVIGITVYITASVTMWKILLRMDTPASSL